MSIVGQPIQYAIGQCWVADLLVPAGNRQLRGQDGRTRLVLLRLEVDLVLRLLRVPIQVEFVGFLRRDDPFISWRAQPLRGRRMAPSLVIGVGEGDGGAFQWGMTPDPFGHWSKGKGVRTMRQSWTRLHC